MDDLSASDRCVKCGLCLPHCPTFTVTGNEADSPRGRISLIQAVDQPEVPWSPGLFRHLDQCLQCQACEAMCPSKVPFGQLMDSARAAIEPHRRRSLLRRMARSTGLRLIASGAGMKFLDHAFRIYRMLGLQRLVARTPGLPSGIRRLNRLLPVAKDRARPAPCAATEQHGEVNLFTGCIGGLFDRQTLEASKRLLQRLGYRVKVTRRQRCCGALHQHNGDPETAARLAHTNRQAFSGDANPILVTASGCTAHLTNYGKLYDTRESATLAERVSDILRFLVTLDRGDLQIKPLEETVAVYVPCTHRNVLGRHQDILDILDWIPGLNRVIVNPGGGCCGAAGSYMLSQPELSEQLRKPLIETIVQNRATILVTSNIGCSIQLQAGLREHGAAIEVLHPVVLLERLLIATNHPERIGESADQDPGAAP